MITFTIAQGGLAKLVRSMKGGSVRAGRLSAFWRIAKPSIYLPEPIRSNLCTLHPRFPQTIFTHPRSVSDLFAPPPPPASAPPPAPASSQAEALPPECRHLSNSLPRRPSATVCLRSANWPGSIPSRRSIARRSCESAASIASRTSAIVGRLLKVS